MQDAKGHAYTEKPTTAGIFEVKAVIDGQDYLFKRKKDDPHSSKKEGENDCYGVADEVWQFDLWEASKGTLGSKIYAEAVKKGNFPKNSAKEPRQNKLLYSWGDEVIPLSVEIGLLY